MTIARTLSCLLVVAGFCVSPLAFAQGQTEAHAAAPEVAPAAAPEGNPAAPARSVLWPDFQVGQHVVLEMTYLDTSKTPKPILATINVEVIDKTDDVFTIRWTPSNARIPRDLPNRAMAPFMCVWDGTAGPTLDILIQEDLGVIGLANWEAARDQTVRDAKKAIIGLKGSDGFEITPEMADELVDPMRDTILANQDATEATLLRNARGYFDGSYHEVTPGDSLTEAIELPWPFGDAAEGLFLPMTRTTTLSTIVTDPAPVYELLIDLKPDGARFKELVTSLADQVSTSLKSEEVIQQAESAAIKARWTLDMAKGWPTQASSTVHSKGADKETRKTVAWTLVEGPTMKAAEPKPAACAQPDAAPPAPATPQQATK